MAFAYDYLIIGAGLTGCVLAERLATQKDKKVLIVERRNHVGGNCHDLYDEHGVLIHPYGPHIFHTNDEGVMEYLRQFSSWSPYEHRVLASVEDRLFPFPINMNTLELLWGQEFSSSEDMEAFLKTLRQEGPPPANAAEQVCRLVGKELYALFFEKYTHKQWGIPAEALAPEVTARIPVRYNRDDRYFSDTYQCMPEHGYHRLFAKLLEHDNISVLLQTSYQQIASAVEATPVIYTGPIDEYYNQEYGPLGYRSVRLQWEYRECSQAQEAAVINYPNSHDFTRITEYKQLTGQSCEGTVLSYEYPCDGTYAEEKYYPIPTAENQSLYQKYAALAKQNDQVHFCGRLGDYRYYNMDHAVRRALDLAAELP